MTATKPASAPPPESEPTPLHVESLALYDAVSRGEHTALKAARVPS